MKRILTLIACAFLMLSAYAQAPNKMSYQAVIRNATNTLVVNKPVGMRISILQGSATGTAVFVETHTPTTNVNGLVSIEIGGGSPITGTFANINWANGPYFVKTETDPTGSNNYSITGISQLLSVPYALYAKNSTSVTNPPSLSNILFSGNSADNKNIKNLASPVDSYDAVNKKYVDSMFMRILNSISPSNEFYTSPTTGILTDAAGFRYAITKIGSQWWMAENLRTTKYRDGTDIPNIKDSALWLTTTNGAWCNYNHNIVFDSIYGKLYNWHAVSNPKQLAPKGWKIPNNEDWDTLSNFLGGNLISGYKMKATNSWLSIGNGDNSSGFNAFGSGYYGYGFNIPNFAGLNYTALWWTSMSNSNNTYADSRSVSSNYNRLDWGTYPKHYGFAIRCVKE